MFKEFLRLFAIFLLIIIIIMDDFPFYENLKDTTIQLLLAILVIVCILFDTTFGFIMGLVLIVVYYEIYKKIIKQKKDIDIYKNNIQVKNKEQINNKQCGELSYLSDEHLISALNNIFDINNFKSEIKGVEKGFNNEKVYGVQGLDTEHINQPGFDKLDKYSML